MFCDIRSFTSIAEKMSPQNVMLFINRYLEFAGPVIRKHNGFVDKYLGDGIMAVFPGESPDAGRAALEIVDGTPAIDGSVNARVGMGLHRGSAMLGTIGENDRLDTTVLSDAVNTASRLQALSGGYGADILASDTGSGYPDASGHYYIRFVDRVRLKGKERAVTVYQIMPKHLREMKREMDHLYEEAFRALKMRDVKSAEEEIEVCLGVHPTDSVYQMLKVRIEDLAKNGFPNDWDGTVTRMIK